MMKMHKNNKISLCFGSVISIVLIIVGVVCHSHKDKNIQQIWHGRVSWEPESNTTMLRSSSEKAKLVTPHKIPPECDRTHSTKPMIAICAATHSKSTWRSLDDTTLKSLLIPSIERTISTFDLSKYAFRLYLAADHDDHFWLNHQNNLKTPDWLSLHIGFYEVPEHKIPFNPMMRAAYNDGAEYMVRINDDSEFMTSDWVSKAVAKLASYDPPNVGMVGPNCLEGNTAIMTHDMVHRTHLDIFKHYYPDVFSAWWIDDWISRVYGPERSTKMMDWSVKHHIHEHGTRYKVQGHEAQLLNGELENGRDRIEGWLKKKSPLNTANDKHEKSKPVDITIESDSTGNCPTESFQCCKPIRCKTDCTYDIREQDCCDNFLFGLLQKVQPLFEKIDSRHFITWGTLLSSVRKQNVMAWDTDIDIAITQEKYKHLHDSIALFKKHGLHLFNDRHDGLYRVCYRDTSSILSNASPGSKGNWAPYVDIYSAKVSEKYVGITGKPINGFQKDTIFPLSQCSIRNIKVKCPRKPIVFLERVYGSTWETPNKKFHAWRDSAMSALATKKISVVTDVINFRFKPEKYPNWLKTKKSKHGFQVDTSVNLLSKPEIFKTFDYEVHGPSAYNEIKGNAKSAKIVYIWPAKALSYKFDEFDVLKTGEKRILVAMGEDTHSSKLTEKQKSNILRKFSTVFWEANTDVDFETLPMGLNLLYVALNGLEKTNHAINHAKDKQKTKLCCIPKWNKLSTELERPELRVASRTRLQKFIENKQDWYDSQNWEPQSYYENIGLYKFAACPTGNGIQAPKIYEALLVRTIPIVENELAFRQLKEMGLPLLIVNDWTELNENFLMDKYSTMNVDWPKVIDIITTQGVIKYIKTLLEYS